MKKIAFLLGLLVCFNSFGAVTLPYIYGTNVPPSQANANDQALRDEINAHEALHNGHNTALSDVLGVGSTVGSYSINFNNKELFSARVENVSSDPTCDSSFKARMVFNTVDGLLKVCDGSSFISIAGTGVNTLASVLSAGNSAGSNDLNLNERQLKNARIENLSVDPSAGNIGRLFYNTTDSAFRIDNGSSIVTLGGSQGLSSVLGISNSAGSTNIDLNGNKLLNFRAEVLSTDPASTYSGRVYFNSTSNKLRFYTGSAWAEVGNTNTLAQTMSLGNSVGSNDLNMNGHQLQNARLHNLASAPGTGSAGTIWYDTGTDQLQFETAGASNRYVATLDDAQTLTNKGISGSSNTLSNIPDSALSSNVALKNAAQTITGKKTFSTNPVLSAVETPSGATHLITDGLPNDTFTLNKASQELESKTLKSPTLSGNIDFNNFQGVKMRVENRTSNPTVGNAGRIYYNSATGELRYDTGTSWLVLTSNISGSGISLTDLSAIAPLAYDNTTGVFSMGAADDLTDGYLTAADHAIFKGKQDAGLALLKANNLSDIPNSATARGNLGLGTAAVQASGFFLQKANDLSDLNSASTARSNLGLGSAATQATATFAQTANNLSDLSSPSTARTNLGLGTIATKSATIGTGVQKGDGSGGFTTASSGTDFAPATSGTAIQKANGSGGFSAAVAGTDYVAATSGSSLQKANGSGGLTAAAAGTDYAAATTGTSSQLLANNGSGGFSNVAVGTNLTLSAGTLSATGGGSPSNSFIYMTQGNGYGGSSSGESHVRNFTNTAGSNGSDISYSARDSTHGDKFTINTDGVYEVCYTDTSTVSNMGLGYVVGISAGSSLLSGNIESITYAQGLRGYINVAVNGSVAEFCRSGFFTAGTVIRAMTGNASSSSVAANETFSIVRMW